MARPGPRVVLSLRLAGRFLRGGDLTDRVRALLTVVAIGLSVSVVLLTLVAFAALTDRENRADALTPRYVQSPWSADPDPTATPQDSGRPFWVDVQEQPYRGQPITVVTIAQPVGAPTDLPLPPGADTVPEPGQAVVSPALARLLASPDGTDLRTRLPETVVGTLTDDGLLDDADLRAYVGVTKTFEAGESGRFLTATGWGNGTLPNELRPGATLRIMMLAGVVVIVTPLLVLIGLLGRLGGPARERRLATLRLLGAPASMARAVAGIEAALLGLAGAALAVAAFPLITRVIVGLPLDGVPLSARSLTLDPLVVIAAAAAVGIFSALAGVIGVGRPTAAQWATARRTGNRPPRWWPGVATLGAGLLLLAAGLTNGGLYANSRMLLALCAGLALTLVSVASLAGPAVTMVGRWVRPRGPVWTLAASRIAADPRARAATVAGVGVVLAGAIALQAVLALVAADRTAPGGSTAPAYRIFLTPNQPDLTVGDSAGVVDTLSSASGVEDVTGGFFLSGEFGTGVVERPEGSLDMSQTINIMIAPCAAIPERPACQDGDVFAIDQSAIVGVAGSIPPTGSIVRVTSDEGSADWTVPATTATVTLEADLRNSTPYNLFVTPGALGSLADLPASAASIDFRVFGPASTETADQLRAALTAQGWRVQLDSTAEATGARGNLLAVGRAGLAGTAGLTLLAALGGLLVLTFAQVNRNRRAVALALAAGVPRTVLRRSFVVEAAVSAAAVVPIATAVAYGLAAVLTRLGRPATDLPSIGVTAALALGATTVTVLAAWLAATLAVRTVDVTDLRTG